MMTWDKFRAAEPEKAEALLREYHGFEDDPCHLVFRQIDWTTVDYKHFCWKAWYPDDPDFDPWYWCDGESCSDGHWVS
jgi:hypothetical protein